MMQATLTTQHWRTAGASVWGPLGLRSVACLYLAAMIAVPVGVIVANGFGHGVSVFWSNLTSPIALSALKLTLVCAGAMTLVNIVMGTLTAFVLVRCPFPGRSIFNGLVDLPFAVPTLVTGVMLVVLYGPQRMLGQFLENNGFQVIFATPGIVLALLFVTYPFVIRSVQPVLIGAEVKQEEAAMTLGATRWETFRHILLPTLLPAIITGSLLSFARALGEFGSIVIVAGNIPNQTLTAPVYVYGQIESQNQAGASAMSTVLLATSFTLMVTVDWLQRREGKRHA